METSDESQCNVVVAYAPVAIFAALVLLQGGFFSLASCLVGAIVAVTALVVLIVRRKQVRDLAFVPILLALFSASYLASSIANTATLTQLSESGRWFAVTAFAFLCAAQTRKERERAWDALTWLLVLFAAIGIAMFCGLFASNGAMHNGRLQFFLQYANSAAMLFVAGSFLCLMGSRRQARAAFLPVLAFLVTKSAGAAAVFAIAAVCYAAYLLRRRRYEHFLLAVLQLITAVALFAISLKIGAMLAFAIALAAAAIWQLVPSLPGECSACRLRNLSILAVVLLIAVVVGVVLLNNDRLAQACGTFTTRLAQMKAALALFSQSPLLGAGPDNWQYLYPYVQDATFRTKTVHNGYLQIAVDGGAIALIVFAATAVVGLRNQVSGRDARATMTAALILAHVAVDFDLRFTCIAALLAFSLVSPLAGNAQSNRQPNESPRSLANVAHLAAIALCLAMCSAGFWSSAAASKVEGYAREGEMAQVVQACMTTPLASHDVHMQNLYLEALAELGEWEAIVSFGENNVPVGDIQAIVIARGYAATGDSSTARSLLEAELAREPFNKTLHKNAEAILAGLD